MITTRRLLLRRYTLADAQDLVALFADPDVKRFVPEAEPFGRQQAAERIRRDERDWEQGNRSLAIVRRATGAFLGRVTLRDLPYLSETDLGWMLCREARGNGFATEAARAFAAWGFANLRVDYLTAIIRPENLPSIRVAERLGMTLLRHDFLFDGPVLVYSISRDAWPGGLDVKRPGGSSLR